MAGENGKGSTEDGTPRLHMLDTVAHGSSVPPLLGLTSESCIKYHIWLGHFTLILFTAHGALYPISWAYSHQLSGMVNWHKTGISNLAGGVSLLGGLVLWVGTVRVIRRKAFELFFYAHYFYIVFYAWHVSISSMTTVLPDCYLFLLDRLPQVPSITTPFSLAFCSSLAL